MLNSNHQGTMRMFFRKKLSLPPPAALCNSQTTHTENPEPDTQSQSQCQCQDEQRSKRIQTIYCTTACRAKVIAFSVRIKDEENLQKMLICKVVVVCVCVMTMIFVPMFLKVKT